MTPEEHLIHQNIRLARKLPLPDAVLLLRGLLELCGDTAAAYEVRVIYTQLSESDRQLALFEIGQLKLSLDRPPSGNGPGSTP
jgi:hypothetical protein